MLLSLFIYLPFFPFLLFFREFSPNSSSYTSAAVVAPAAFLFCLADLTLTTTLDLPSFAALLTCFSASSQAGASPSISYLKRHVSNEMPMMCMTRQEQGSTH